MQIRLQSCTYEPGENSMYIHVYTIICVGQLYGAISKRAMAHSKRDEFNQRNRACIIRSSLQFGVQLEVEFSATSLLLSALLLLAHCAHCTLRPTVVLLMSALSLPFHRPRDLPHLSEHATYATLVCTSNL